MRSPELDCLRQILEQHSARCLLQVQDRSQNLRHDFSSIFRHTILLMKSLQALGANTALMWATGVKTWK